MQSAWKRQSRALILLCGAAVVLGTLGVRGAKAQIIPIQEIQVTERVETTPLSVPERRENRTDLPVGKTKTVFSGAAGFETKTFQQIKVDGKIVSEKLISSIRTESKPKVIYIGVGSKGRPGSVTLPSRSLTRSGRTAAAAAKAVTGGTSSEQLKALGFGKELWPMSVTQQVYGRLNNWNLEGGKVMTVNSTAYNPDAGLSNPTFKTATGRPARHGMVAVDPRVIPMNSLLYIENYGWAVAADTGGAIKGMKVDVCLESRQEAMQWGRRKIRIIVFPKLVTQDLPSRSRRG